MTILYYFQKFEDSMFLWQVYHIVDELKHHNINIEIFNPLIYDGYEQANHELIIKLKSKSYDLFMTDQTRKTLYIDALTRIKEIGIPMLLIHFDNLMDPRRYLGYAEYFDAVMLLNKDTDFNYKKYKCHCIFAPYAANPYYFSDLREKIVSHNNICFIGTPYGTRCIPINFVTNNGIPLDLYANADSILKSYHVGGSLKTCEKIRVALRQMETHTGRVVLKSALKCKLFPIERLEKDNNFINVLGTVNLQKMNELYSSYSLSLSMPEARNTGVLKNPINVVRLRNFEIPMCAGLQITKYYDELAECFEENKEILFYKSNEELLEKIKYYTSDLHQNEVNLMKTNARKRAENEHTWYKRFEKVFDYLRIKTL